MSAIRGIDLGEQKRLPSGTKLKFASLESAFVSGLLTLTTIQHPSHLGLSSTPSHFSCSNKSRARFTPSVRSLVNGWIVQVPTIDRHLLSNKQANVVSEHRGRTDNESTTNSPTALIAILELPKVVPPLTRLAWEAF